MNLFRDNTVERATVTKILCMFLHAGKMEELWPGKSISRSGVDVNSVLTPAT